MATAPEQVRRGLQVVTAASVADLRVVAEQRNRAALFAATPLIVSAYTEGSAALALDWYDEAREESEPAQAYAPVPVALVREEQLATAVAWATVDELTREEVSDPDRVLLRLAPVVQKEVAAGFWNTVTRNAENDPEAAGWRRIARPNACPFCRMLADKGAVYSSGTARFAAHRACHCVAAPVFGRYDGPEASVMQYVASRKRRSPADKARLREYLKQHYGA